MGTGNTRTLKSSKHLHRGSSPWARGTHRVTSASFCNSRFIPVGTGNTRKSLGVLASTAVHPRGHGEHFLIAYNIMVNTGSSPWARGTPRNKLIQVITHRFIPVGTGNTHAIRHNYATRTVHPRGHGEHLTKLAS